MSLLNMSGVNVCRSTINNIGGDQQNITNNNYVTSSTIDFLPYADGASWDPSRTCLSGTREMLLRDIWSWIHSTDVGDMKRVFLLTSVAGAGKSVIAHTVAKHCHEECLLGSSFFFDRHTDGRNNPRKLFSTIAYDLAVFNADLRRQVTLAIDLDRSIASAPISRQFDELLCSMKYYGEKPVVIVIDALDEGYDTDLQLLTILRDRIQKLPSKFRLIITSRPVVEILSFLSQSDHIRREIIDIHEQANLDDIAIYARDRLREVASLKKLSIDWPGQELTSDFITKAEGLFIWVATVSRYLGKATHPDKKLATMLSKHSTLGLPAEAKMDELYSVILGACDWTDDDFVKGYHLFMGTIIAAKTPISISVLQSLHRNRSELQAREVLAPLCSLLSGLDPQDQPIRVLHFSLREFLTLCDRCTPKSKHFYLSEKEHNQRLALLCLTVLNQDLGKDILEPSSNSKWRILNIAKYPTLWYACQFWIDHVTEVDSTFPELIDALRTFLTTSVKIWAKVMVSKGRFRKLSEVRAWIERVLEDEHDFDDAFSISLALKFRELAGKLYSRGCYDGAVEAAEESVAIYQHPSTKSLPVSVFLTDTLNDLSKYRSRLGRQNESLEAAREAVTVCRSLPAENPSTEYANSNVERLSASLNSLAKSLSNLGYPEEALKAAEEAVATSELLVAREPAKYNHILAYSLCRLAQCLHHLNRHMDALHLFQKSESIYRSLNASCSPSLAHCLRNIARCLAHLGEPDFLQALDAANKSVSIYRLLARTKPIKYDSDLSTSLVQLAQCFSGLSNYEEACRVIKEAVKLRRRLAEDALASSSIDLGISLCHLANCLHSLHRWDEATTTLAEAIQLRQKLDGNIANGSDLAISRIYLDNYLSSLRDQGGRAFIESESSGNDPSL